MSCCIIEKEPIGPINILQDGELIFLIEKYEFKYQATNTIGGLLLPKFNTLSESVNDIRERYNVKIDSLELKKIGL